MLLPNSSPVSHTILSLYPVALIVCKVSGRNIWTRDNYTFELFYTRKWCSDLTGTLQMNRKTQPHTPPHLVLASWSLQVDGCPAPPPPLRSEWSWGAAEKKADIWFLCVHVVTTHRDQHAVWIVSYQYAVSHRQVQAHHISSHQKWNMRRDKVKTTTAYKLIKQDKLTKWDKWTRQGSAGVFYEDSGPVVVYTDSIVQ